MMILMTQLQDNHTDSQPVELLYVCHIVIKGRQQLHQALYHIYRVSLENGILWKTFKLIKNSKVGGVLENSGYLLQYNIPETYGQSSAKLSVIMSSLSLSHHQFSILTWTN